MSDQFAIVTPCYNEEQSIIPFLQRLEMVLSAFKIPFLVVVVDDCSQDRTLELLNSFRFQSDLLSLCILKLKYNIGHQSAIYQGLMYAHQVNAQRVIVMDSDGEDDPRAIPFMLNCVSYDIVEVRRGKRSESFLFILLYTIYKAIFQVITGKRMNYGNYCMINRSILERISHTSFIHFPAYLLKQKASRTSVKFDRDKRIHGKSKMGMKGLLMHSFKSFIEFSEDLLMIFLKLFGLIILILVILLVDVLYQKFVTHTAILGWTSTLILGLVNIAILCLGFFVTGILLLNLMHQQNNKTEQPIYTVIRNQL